MNERRLPNQYEMESIEYLLGFESVLQKISKDIFNRLSEEDRQRFDEAKAIVSDITTKLLDTIPVKSLKHMEHVVKASRIVLTPKSITKSDGYQVVSEKALELLIDTAISSECEICLKTPSETKACKLRRTLEDIAQPDDSDPNTDDCPYFSMLLSREKQPV